MEHICSERVIVSRYSLYRPINVDGEKVKQANWKPTVMCENIDASNDCSSVPFTEIFISKKEREIVKIATAQLKFE